MRSVGGVLAVTACLMLSGCSGRTSPGATADPQPGDSGGVERSGSGTADGRVIRPRASKEGPPLAGPGETSSPVEGSGPDRVGVGRERPHPRDQRNTEGKRPGLASRVASRSDPSGDGDHQGEVPAYTDIRRATVSGRSGRVRLVVRVNSAIPAAMPHRGSDMIVNFQLEMRERADHQIYAFGDAEGWTADFNGARSSRSRFAIVRDRFVFELPWKELGGPARFKWLAQTSWTRSPDGPLSQTQFAFDQVPEYEEASYPE